jgi:hypothetical protein
MGRIQKLALSCSVLLVCLSFAAPLMVAQAPAAAVTPDAGQVTGSTYTSSYFGFTYRIPDGWVVRATGGKLPGVPGNLLFMLKRKSGDALSMITVSAAQMPADYRNDVSRYLEDRYRVNQSSNSSFTINGLPPIRSKRNEAEADLVALASHSFYRIEVETPSASRTALATLSRGYVLVFEVMGPTRDADNAARELVDSMYALTFPNTEPTQQSEKR